MIKNMGKASDQEKKEALAKQVEELEKESAEAEQTTANDNEERNTEDEEEKEEEIGIIDLSELDELLELFIQINDEADQKDKVKNSEGYKEANDDFGENHNAHVEAYYKKLYNILKDAVNEVIDHIQNFDNNDLDDDLDILGPEFDNKPEPHDAHIKDRDKYQKRKEERLSDIENEANTEIDKSSLKAQDRLKAKEEIGRCIKELKGRSESEIEEFVKALGKEIEGQKFWVRFGRWISDVIAPPANASPMAGAVPIFITVPGVNAILLAALGVSAGYGVWKLFDDLDHDHDNINYKKPANENKRGSEQDENRKKAKEQGEAKIGFATPPPDPDHDDDGEEKFRKNLEREYEKKGWKKNLIDDWVEPYSEKEEFEGIKNKPSTDDKKLQSIYDQLYRDSDKVPGGSAQMLREEAKHKIINNNHYKKVFDRYNGINKILQNWKDHTLSKSERETAEKVFRDLKDAINKAKEAGLKMKGQ